MTADYEIITDIDMIGFDWIPIGEPGGFRFIGTLDGRHHTISNLTITAEQLEFSAAGLFGQLGTTAAPGFVIQNIIMTNVSMDVVGSSGLSNYGCLAGNIIGRGSLSNCRVQGSIFNTRTTGSTYLRAGGFAGTITGTSNNTITVDKCSSNVIFTSKGPSESLDIIGGFAGQIGSASGFEIITDCYATGSIVKGVPIPTIDPTYYGGFVGLSSTAHATKMPLYINCYSATPIWDSFVLNKVGGFCGNDVVVVSKPAQWVECYWDTDIGVSDTDGSAVGKTTNQMYQEATFTNWDFDDIWTINEGSSYPTLRWQSILAFDENPAVIMKDLLTNDRYGAGIDESTHINTDSFDAAEIFCDANGLRFSFVIDSQRPVLDWIDFINSHFQGYLYFSQGKISLGILKEETSVFTITRDQLFIEEGENPDPPVQIEKRVTSETVNRIEVTWRNRDKNYDTSVAIAMDEVDQRVTGKVRKRIVQMIGITNKELAQRTAYRLLFESLYRFSTYNFVLSYQNMLLEVGDVGTITDGFLLTDEKIRITSIEEDKDGRGLAIQAIEDTAYIYEKFEFLTQDSERVEDGAPTLVDAQATFTESLTDQGFIISIAPGGVDVNGWQIYKSFDDTTYEFVGQANIDEPDESPTNSTGVTISSLPSHKTGSVYAGEEEIIVDIGTVTVLDTAITDDQFFNNKRLCKIGNDIMAYKTCVQTAIAGQWKITGLIRGLFTTEPVAHAPGETFWTINIDFNFAYADSDIGKTLYFKFLTLHGSSIQSLSDVSGIPYVVQGEIKRPLPVALMRIRDRDGLTTYETDDVTIDFYFSSKTAGFNLGGFGSVGWGIYIMDTSLIALNVLLEEEDGADILEQRFLLSEYQEEPALDIFLADRNGKNPIVVNMTPESELVSNQTRNITITSI